jgi:hypothetical protein
MQGFTGTLLADDPPDLDILLALSPIRVGGRRTTHGLAEVAIADGEPAEPQSLDPLTFVLRLRSPGIFTDTHGLAPPRTRPRGARGRARRPGLRRATLDPLAGGRRVACGQRGSQADRAGRLRGLGFLDSYRTGGGCSRAAGTVPTRGWPAAPRGVR